MKIKKIEHFIKKYLRSHGVYFGKKTSDKELKEFLQKVRPIKTQYELIRIGEKSDGGYLIPNHLSGITCCFSPGVSAEVHLELELTKKGIRSYLADYSIEKCPIDHPLIDFEKKFIGITPSQVFIPLEDWIIKKVDIQTSEMILQMDIEGAEYDVIFDTSNNTLKKFRIIVIEFHRLDTLLDRYGFQIINAAFSKLLKNFSIVHIHPNNSIPPTKYKQFELPPVMEFTFLRNDEIKNCGYATEFPHPLDIINNPDKNDFALPKCWYGTN